ncbi:hypothetical protein FISHEDRAFT_69581 [Fistulina hepatica ATCC 64428]|uniref:Uncharacterized protein n=1 Tax=Fistulina hepatica ATCC 64428 TaxID=1128425 RepID=A0A0D7AM02_9AGAR|nr:hypothetical protein FISHEDRAFT_69581 [Fistulina hepatica ATCC 64428]
MASATLHCPASFWGTSTDQISLLTVSPLNSSSESTVYLGVLAPGLMFQDIRHEQLHERDIDPHIRLVRTSGRCPNSPIDGPIRNSAGFFTGLTCVLILRMWFGKAVDDFNNTITYMGDDAPAVSASVGNAFVKTVPITYRSSSVQSDHATPLVNFRLVASQPFVQRLRRFPVRSANHHGLSQRLKSQLDLADRAAEATTSIAMPHLKKRCRHNNNSTRNSTSSTAPATVLTSSHMSVSSTTVRLLPTVSDEVSTVHTNVALTSATTATAFVGTTTYTTSATSMSSAAGSGEVTIAAEPSDWPTKTQEYASATASTTSAADPYLEILSEAYNNTNNPLFTREKYSGQMTWYDTGIVACGDTYTDDTMTAAVSHTLYDAWPGADTSATNRNPVCGPYTTGRKTETSSGYETVVAGDEYIYIDGDGLPACDSAVTGGAVQCHVPLSANVSRVQDDGTTKWIIVRIVDRCTGCDEQDIDMTPTAFAELADTSLGRVNATWHFVQY